MFFFFVFNRFPLWPKRSRTSTEHLNSTQTTQSIIYNTTQSEQNDILKNTTIEILNSTEHTINVTTTFKNHTKKLENSKKLHFMQSLMTKLGLNACPPIPPNLDGPIEVDTSEEPLKNVIKRLESKLQPGGWYRPKECNAKDRVAIIVPYRDRETHLPILLKNLHPFLMKQQIEYGIFIIEQISGSPFNRAALMNVGFIEALKLSNWDCFVFHDVDLLPLDDRNLYTCPDQPRHMSVAVDTMSFK